MLLRYLGVGKRHYGEHPMPAHPRMNWEFLAVARGRIAPYDSPAVRVTPMANTLWLFPPGVVHGWAGDRGETCELIVMHYSSVPQPIAQLALKHGHLETALRACDLALLHRLARSLKEHYWRPTVESELRAQRALMDLCLLVVRPYRERTHRQVVGGSYHRVVAAEDWLRNRLPESPSVQGAAHAVGLSVSQLNRLFNVIRKESPQAFLNRLKIDRAMDLLGRSNAKLEKVAVECGFSTASNLCRAFKAMKGRSPTEWRRETFIQYKIPGKGVEADHTQHGRRYRPVL